MLFRSPPGDPGLWRHAVEVAENYEPLDPAELAKLKEAAEDIEPLFPKR